MSTPDDPADDEVLSAYRRASGADAGRPSAATRAAILAEARAAAARRRPAANDSRFAWRVAASLAVVGVALVVWRQLPPGTTTSIDTARAPAVVAELREETPVVKVESRKSAPSADAAAAGFAAPAAAPAAAPPQPREIVAPPPPVIVDLEVRQPLPEASESLRAMAPAPAASEVRAQQSAQRAGVMNDLPAVGVDALVRREFPTLLGDATPPAGVWIVQDNGGRTLRTGTLAQGESLGAVMGRLQRELPDRQLRPFEIANLRTTQGAMVLVGVSRLE